MLKKIKTPLGQFAFWLCIILMTSLGYNSYEQWKIDKLSNNLFHNQHKNSEQIVLRKDPDGHFYVKAAFTNKKIHLKSKKLPEIEMLIDSGASKTMLSLKDAKKAGINIRRLKFDDQYQTANGIIYAANFIVPYMKLGDFILTDVAASVTKSDMNVSLLGMSTLKHFNITFSDQHLIIAKN